MYPDIVNIRTDDVGWGSISTAVNFGLHTSCRYGTTSQV